MLLAQPFTRSLPGGASPSPYPLPWTWEQWRLGWPYALKLKSDVVVVPSTLREVVWQVGKGGKVTPVAIFDEVEIEDAKITRATLHNAGFVKDLDLHIGDDLLITRSGGVIPKILGKL